MNVSQAFYSHNHGYDMLGDTTTLERERDKESERERERLQGVSSWKESSCMADLQCLTSISSIATRFEECVT